MGYAPIGVMNKHLPAEHVDSVAHLCVRRVPRARARVHACASHRKVVRREVNLLAEPVDHVLLSRLRSVYVRACVRVHLGVCMRARAHQLCALDERGERVPSVVGVPARAAMGLA